MYHRPEAVATVKGVDRVVDLGDATEAMGDVVVHRQLPRQAPLDKQRHCGAALPAPKCSATGVEILGLRSGSGFVEGGQWE